MKHPVHVVSVEAGMEEAVRRLAAADSRLMAFGRGDKVILKPNFVAPRRASTGTTTSLVLIRELARLLKDLGAEPWLCESPGMEYDWKEVFEYLGIEQLARETGLQVLNFRESPFVEMERSSNRHLRKIRVPALLREAAILNLPKLKTHVTTRVTLGMKNLMGLCHDETKRYMHVRGIEGCIADLNRMLCPAYTVIDGEAAMEGDGGVYGSRLQVNVLLGGANPAAVDQAGCRLMGVDPDDIPHIRAHSDSVEAEIHGSLQPRAFRLPRHTALYHAFYRGLYAVDYLFQKVAGEHFNRWLYRTGYFGTRPRILAEICDRCEECVKVCPTSCIDLKTLSINPGSCIRCLDCFDACPIDAIRIHGFSNPHNAGA